MITGLGDKCIFLSTNFSAIGMSMYDTSVKEDNAEKQLSSTDIKLEPDTVKYVDDIISQFESEV